MAPLVLILLGVLLIWLSATGRLAVFLAALFQPERVTANGG